MVDLPPNLWSFRIGKAWPKLIPESENQPHYLLGIMWILKNEPAQKYPKHDHWDPPLVRQYFDKISQNGYTVGVFRVSKQSSGNSGSFQSRLIELIWANTHVLTVLWKAPHRATLNFQTSPSQKKRTRNENSLLVCDVGTTTRRSI